MKKEEPANVETGLVIKQNRKYFSSFSTILLIPTYVQLVLTNFNFI